MTPLAFARPAGQRGRLYSDMENGGLLHYKGYTARPEYSAEDRIFYGKILGISDLIDFQSESTQDLEDEFHNAVDDYLAFCAETGKLPEQEHIGTKMITVPELESNAEEYVEMAQTQDIFIAENGKVVAKLTTAEQQRA